MGVRFPSVQSNTLVNANVGINTETIVCTTPPLNISLDFATILIFWTMVHTIGTTAATTQWNIRRGTTLAGALVLGPVSQTVTAAQIWSQSGCVFDTPGAVAGQQYTLTCLDVGSTVAGAIAAATLIAFAL